MAHALVIPALAMGELSKCVLHLHLAVARISHVLKCTNQLTDSHFATRLQVLLACVPTTLAH